MSVNPGYATKWLRTLKGVLQNVDPKSVPGESPLRPDTGAKQDQWTVVGDFDLGGSIPQIEDRIGPL
jgi:hypothetical protein